MTRPAEPDAHRPAPPYNCDRCGRRAHPTWLRFDVTLSLAEGDGKTPRATARFLGLPSGRAWTRVLIVAKRGLGGCRAHGHATPRLGATAVGRQRASGRCEGRARACLRATGRGRRAGAQRGDEAANAQSPAAVIMETRPRSRRSSYRIFECRALHPSPSSVLERDLELDAVRAANRQLISTLNNRR